MKTVEVRDVDRGYLAYTIYKHADAYFMLYQTSANIGWRGPFTSFVVVPTLEPLMEFLAGMEEEELELSGTLLVLSINSA